MSELNAYFNQVECGNHNFVLVTQATTITGINNPPIKEQWLQCSKCGYTIPVPEQQNLENKLKQP